MTQSSQLKPARKNVTPSNNVHLLSVVQSLEAGGRTVRIRDTNSGLQQSGIRTTTLSFKTPADWVQDLFGLDLRIRVREKSAGFDFSLFYFLIKFCLIHKVDVIHAHCETSFLYSGLVGRLTRIPVIGTYHRSDLSYFEPSLKLRLFARLLSGCVAISSHRQGLMMNQLGIKEEKIELIPGGVDLGQFDYNKVSKFNARQELGVDPGGKVLLALGHFGLIKGHDVLINALQKIKSDVSNVKLYIGGGGSDTDRLRLEAQVRNLNLEGEVVFLGQVARPELWLAACDVFVTVPREEGFGLVFAEAGAMKKPVVATRVGGIQDIIVDRKTGYLVEPENVVDVASAVTKLLTDPLLAARFGSAGLLHVENSFSKALLVERYCLMVGRYLPELAKKG